MSIQQPTVAVLLATYNGARYVADQIKSLAENVTPFTLHWLDDHSTDDTRDIVRAAAQRAGIELREWHQPRHYGVPGTFFRLLDCVDADIYLFCDQDDLWQRGKIDATVWNLLPDLKKPVLCYSDPLLFYEDEPNTFHRVSETLHVDMKDSRTFQESRSLLFTFATGQSMGMTRPLRELYFGHKDIARAHAYVHSWWMYLLAVVAGEVRLLNDVPTTLYRQHGRNVTTTYYVRNRNWISRMMSQWRMQGIYRRGVAKQAQGFMLASATLPPGPKLERLLALAPLVAKLDRLQSPGALAKLLVRRAMFPWWHNQLWLTAACLWCDARLPNIVPPPVQEAEPGSSVALSDA